MTKHPIFSIGVASLYPHYVAKAKKKGRTKAEVDETIRWLTGYSQISLEVQLEKGTGSRDRTRRGEASEEEAVRKSPRNPDYPLRKVW